VARDASGRDASEATLAVLKAQLRERDPLDAAERGKTITVDTECAIPFARIAARLEAR
jgi:predicted kinase